MVWNMGFDIVRIVLRKGAEAICSLAIVRFGLVNVNEAGPRVAGSCNVR